MRFYPVALVALAVPLMAAAMADTFYVSPHGKAHWSGTKPNPAEDGSDGPFATLEQARDAIRQRKQNLQGTANTTVIVRGGTYFLENRFELTAMDSGWRGGPITYTTLPNETVRLVGARPVPAFAPVTDPAIRSRIDEAARESVLHADLKTAGVTEFPPLTPRGMGRPVTAAHVELFFDGEPMQLARWPNDDWVTIAGVPDGKDGGKFTYDGDRPARWSQAEDLWLHGYWTWDWADSFAKVASIDTASKTFVTAEPHGVYGYKKGQRYYAINLLEELDAPGEYFIDRESGILYFWPPADPVGKEAYVSTTTQLVHMEGVTNVAFANFTLEMCRANAMRVMECSDVVIAGCTVRNTGNAGIGVSGGTGNTVRSCDVYNTGDGGISLVGGHRPTLTPGGHRAINNHVHHYSRWVRTYRSAIALSGVGLTAANNHIHDAPHTGILFGGNDHKLEYNEVHHICQETGDVGAFYIGRDWTARGHVIRHNYFHDITGPYTHGAMAVYLDDVASGVTIYGNIFVNASRAAFIGGGRDNTIENNIFVDCDPSVHIDARLTGWATDYQERGSGWDLEAKLEAMNWKEPPFSERYPELVNVLDDEPRLPKGNEILRNVSYGGRWLDLYDDLEMSIATFESNLVDEDPHFVDPDAGDYRLRDDSPAYDLGFKPIPYGRIGLFADEYRQVQPPQPFPDGADSGE